MTNGLYLPDGSYLRFSEGATASTPTSLSSEIAVRSRSIDYFALGNMYLPNPDPILKAQGRDIHAYTDLLVDDRVGGGVTNRIGAVKSMVWKIERGTANVRQHKAVESVFLAYDMDAILESIVKGARGFGYAPLELIWGQKDGLNSPLNVVGKPQRWFVFSLENELRFRSRDHLMDGEPLPVKKFICPTSEAAYDNPYGVGLLSRCFWPVIFKKGGWRFWTYFSEKYGQVWPVGKLPRSADPKQQSDLLDVLVRMVADGAAVIPDDSSVDFKESATKGATSDLYRGIIAEANNAISTVWHGHAGAGESTTGKLGNDSTALVVRDDLRDDDANLITRTMQQVINWMCEVNWGSSANAPQFVLKAREKIDVTQADRDDKLSTSMERSGLKLTAKYFQDTYALSPEHIEVALPTPIPPPAGSNNGLTLPSPSFADTSNPFTPPQQALEDMLSGLIAQAQSALKDNEARILQAVQSAASYEDAIQNLLDLYPDMNMDTLNGLMERGYFAGLAQGATVKGP